MRGEINKMEGELRWSVNLASKLVGLGCRLGYFFKEDIIANGWSLKRQAKAAWRYLKHILCFVFVEE